MKTPDRIDDWHAAVVAVSGALKAIEARMDRMAKWGKSVESRLKKLDSRIAFIEQWSGLQPGEAIPAGGKMPAPPEKVAKGQESGGNA